MRVCKYRHWYEMSYASPLYGTIPWEVLLRRDSMHTNILVVYKKNFEEVHDEGLMSLKTILQEVASTSHQVDYKPREHVRLGYR